MKKMIYAGAVLCAMALTTGCSNEELMENGKDSAFSLKATTDTDTRTSVNEQYNVLWNAGDAIYVYGDGVKGTLTLTSGENSSSGTFGGTLKGAADNLQYALYPAEVGAAMTFYFPATYTYPYDSNSPMYATFGTDKSSVSFKHLCSMVRLKFNGVPTEGEKTLTLTSKDGNIAGNAVVSEGTMGLELAAPSAEGKSVSITIPDGTPTVGTSLTFDIPLPAGSYASGLSIALKKGESTVIAEKTVNNVALEVGEIMVMPELTYISIEGEAPSFVEAEHVDVSEVASKDFNDPTKSYVIEGGESGSDLTLTEAKTIVAKAVIMSDLNVSSPKALNIVAESVTMSDVKLAGEQPKANGNAMMSINNAKQISISGMTISKTQGYNAIEIGLGKDSELPSEINIDNVKVEAAVANNAILIFGTQNNAVVNITNCDFGTVSNCLRLSNKTNATGVQVNIKNCKVTKWETADTYQGFLICEDYTNKTADEAVSNNLFAKEKITVTFDNVTNPNNEKINFTNDVAAGAYNGANNPSQVYYVHRDYGGGLVSYGDGSCYPTFIFK